MIVAVGARFGALTVERGLGEGRVLCRCDCGRIAGRALGDLDDLSSCRVCATDPDRRRRRYNRRARNRRRVRRNADPTFRESERQWARDYRARKREGEAVRPHTINVERLSRRDIEKGRLLFPESVDRPTTRGECEHALRPCPFVSCRHHLYLDVNPDNGSIKINWPGVELEDMPATCALDVADEGGTTLEDVAIALNLTRERARQVVDRITARLAHHFGPWAPEGTS